MECIRDYFLDNYATQANQNQAILQLVIRNEWDLTDFVVKDLQGNSDPHIIKFQIV